MKQFKLLLGLMLLTLLVFSCKEDEEATPENVSGTYTLTSITTDVAVDPDANEVFDDTELIDNITCASRLILDDTNGFVWEDVSIYQSGTTGYIVDYSSVTCDTSEETGTYSVTDESLILNGNNTIIFNVINNNELEYLGTFSLVIEESGSAAFSSVAATMKYTK